MIHNHLFLLIYFSGTRTALITRNPLHKDPAMRTTLTAPALVALLALNACSTSPTHTQVGTVTGAVIGGVVGSALTGGSTAGTVAGAGAGAAVGYEIGKRVK
jgi:osmotically inducible lipoprotein OsmB